MQVDAEVEAEAQPFSSENLVSLVSISFIFIFLTSIFFVFVLFFSFVF